jgi:hypothetical protein
MSDSARYAIVIVQALEALEVGDIRGCEAMLLGAIEDVEVFDPHGRRSRCTQCGAGPYWPGELSHHEFAVHPPALEEAA